MKTLSEFKDEQAIGVVADLLPPIMEVLTNKKNAKLQNESNAFRMFSGFFKNSAKSMLEIFAILSETPVTEYHCDGVDVVQNLLKLSGDERLVQLFISQGQMGDAKSSGSALENAEEN